MRVYIDGYLPTSLVITEFLFLIIVNPQLTRKLDGAMMLLIRIQAKIF